MGEKKEWGIGGSLVLFLLAFVVVLAGFYGLNHLVMGMQGLPLNMDLTPVR